MTSALTDAERRILTTLYQRVVGGFQTVIINVRTAEYIGIEQFELDAMAGVGLAFRYDSSIGQPVYAIAPSGIRAIGGDIAAARHNFSHRRWWGLHLAMVKADVLNIEDDILTDDARWLVKWSLLPTAESRIDAWKQKQKLTGKE